MSRVVIGQEPTTMVSRITLQFSVQVQVSCAIGEANTIVTD